MALYIMGLDMPKNDCTAYREVIISNNYIGDGKTRIYVYDAQTNNFIGEAIEIPEPHGRLIDADELEKRMRKAVESWANLNQTFSAYIDHAPTVIEGSE